jgi:hypothetical protein
MFFLLSGEGPTDIGRAGTEALICEGPDFLHGPMALIVAQIVEAQRRYWILGGACGFVSEKSLAERAKRLRAVGKGIGLPGKKRAKETRYFFNNARALAEIAKEKATEVQDEVAAVLFRDSDGTASAGRGEWANKRQSMLDGFAEEGFKKGVPMIPKPKSEAWLICAFKSQPYQNCEALEERSGNDGSPNSLKRELEVLLGGETDRESLNDRVNSEFDIGQITMPSFIAFKERLAEVI